MNFSFWSNQLEILQIMVFLNTFFEFQLKSWRQRHFEVKNLHTQAILNISFKGFWDEGFRGNKERSVFKIFSMDVEVLKKTQNFKKKPFMVPELPRNILSGGWIPPVRRYTLVKKAVNLWFCKVCTHFEIRGIVTILCISSAVPIPYIDLDKGLNFWCYRCCTGL